MYCDMDGFIGAQRKRSDTMFEYQPRWTVYVSENDAIAVFGNNHKIQGYDDICAFREPKRARRYAEMDATWRQNGSLTPLIAAHVLRLRDIDDLMDVSDKYLFRAALSKSSVLREVVRDGLDAWGAEQRAAVQLAMMVSLHEMSMDEPLSYDIIDKIWSSYIELRNTSAMLPERAAWTLFRVILQDHYPKET